MVQNQLIVKTITVIGLSAYFCVSCHLINLGPVFITKGGTEVQLSDFPFNVIFANYGGLCGGTILSRKLVLTAAHCFTFNKDVYKMKILSNARHIFDFKSTFHKVSDFLVHKHFNIQQSFANDIAIIIIEDTFMYNMNVQPAFIADTDIWMNERETNFTVSGWGNYEFGKDNLVTGKTSELMAASMRFVEKWTCEQWNSVELTREMFCLYGDKKRDTCQGDSGGNVLWRHTVVGIVSHGKGCGEGPSIYTNVYYMKDWINKTATRLYKNFCEKHELCK